MADLTFGDVLWIGAVGTVGLMLVSYWWSGVMARRGWSWQVRKRPRGGGTGKAAPAAASERPRQADRPVGKASKASKAGKGRVKR